MLSRDCLLVKKHVLSLMDIQELLRFYQTPLGKWTKHLLRHHIKSVWPHTHKQRVLGMGYCVPYMNVFLPQCSHAINMMSSRQGAVKWPFASPSLTTLAHEELLPFLDEQFDKVLLVHLLEFCEDTKKLFREVWRILCKGGEALIVFPNSHSLWSQAKHTPFGQGFSYSTADIVQNLEKNLFTVQKKHHALFIPPIQSNFILSSSLVWEHVGQRWLPHVSGVILVEVTKSVYGVSPHFLSTPSCPSATRPLPPVVAFS